ncbi:MAG TPA: glycosyltransferase, partial [Magnetospirillaceae bacterium]|nr:glycosyltransferase [Magnetospirillaceae bacterium]
YAQCNWISMSQAQRAGMPQSTNWVANIYHGLDPKKFRPVANPRGDYVAYLGRIIESKGVHLAIAAAKRAGVTLKIAGKHYAGKKDAYWQEQIVSQLGDSIEYVGFIKDNAAKQRFLGNARALVVPSVFDEPFGMVSIEALACGTPVIGVNSGATGEIIEQHSSGIVVPKTDEPTIIDALAAAIKNIESIDRIACRRAFEARFTLEQMTQEHIAVYKKLQNN